MYRMCFNSLLMLLTASNQLTVFFSVALVNSHTTFAESTDPSEVGERLSSNLRSIKNVAFDVTWTDSIDGGQKGYSVLKTVSDSLGRIRVTELDKGTLDADGNKISSRKGRRDKLFDGEKSVVLNTQDDLDEAGKPIFVPNGEKIYRIAVIADALDGPSKWRDSERNPITFATNSVLPKLKSLAELGQRVELTPVIYEGEEALVARFRERGFDVTVTISPKYSWAIRQIEEKNSNDKVIKHSRYDYVRVQDELYLPTRGAMMWHHVQTDLRLSPPSNSLQSSTAHAIRRHESQFELSNFVVNDPSFDGSVFSISLPIGTRVSDNRYKTTYRVGESAASGAELAALALRAKQHPEPLQRMPRNVSPPPPSSTTWMLLGGAALGVLLIVAAVTARRAFTT